MNYYKGDMVMHWTYGIGQIVNLEERAWPAQKPSTMWSRSRI